MELAECDYCFPPVPKSPSRRLACIYRSTALPSPSIARPPPALPPPSRDAVRTDAQHRRVPRVHLPPRRGRAHLPPPRRPLQQRAGPRPRHPGGHSPLRPLHQRRRLPYARHTPRTRRRRRRQQGLTGWQRDEQAKGRQAECSSRRRRGWLVFLVNTSSRALLTLTFSASDSDLPSGHEDKKQHGSGRAAVASASGSGRRGARKSGGGEVDGKRELSKSERRKEQNRAAQKAFRERREAKVKDVSTSIFFWAGKLMHSSSRTRWQSSNRKRTARRLKMKTFGASSSVCRRRMSLSSSPHLHSPCRLTIATLRTPTMAAFPFPLPRSPNLLHRHRVATMIV